MEPIYCMKDETRRQNPALFDLNWKHTCWVTQIFHHLVCGHDHE